jgi:hypothetical protein
MVFWCRQHLELVRRQHDWDLTCGLGRAPLPGTLARKYPNADRQWGWQWVFPAATHFIDRQTGIRHRFHLHAWPQGCEHDDDLHARAEPRGARLPKPPG